MGSVAGLEPHGEMLFREISPSWTLDGQLSMLRKRKWQVKIGPFGRFSQVGQQVQKMHDAFHDDDDCILLRVTKCGRILGYGSFIKTIDNIEF